MPSVFFFFWGGRANVNLVIKRTNVYSNPTCITFAKTWRPFFASASTFAITSSNTHCLKTKRGFARRESFSRCVCQWLSELTLTHSSFSLSMRVAYFPSQLFHCCEAASCCGLSSIEVNRRRVSIKVSNAEDKRCSGRKRVKCRKVR